MNIIIFTLYSNEFNSDESSLFKNETCEKKEIKKEWNLYKHLGKEKIVENNKYIWKLKEVDNVYAYPCLSREDLDRNNFEQDFLTSLTKDIANLDFTGEFTNEHKIYYVIHDKDIGLSKDDHCLDKSEEDDYFFEYNTELKEFLKDIDFSTLVFQHDGGILYSLINSFEWDKYENEIKEYIIKQIRKCL